VGNHWICHRTLRCKARRISIPTIKAAGCTIFSSATTVTEARWLEDRDADAVIAQGVEAGGHRGMFLTTELASQAGTLVLVPQVVDAVRVPVIAAGGIADGRDCGGACVGRFGAADGHGLFTLPGSAHLCCPPGSPQVGVRKCYRNYQCVDWAASSRFR
jgi:nitronate monooxygenase